jgi:hypothetical protein
LPRLLGVHFKERFVIMFENYSNNGLMVQHLWRRFEMMHWVTGFGTRGVKETAATNKQRESGRKVGTLVRAEETFSSSPIPSCNDYTAWHLFGQYLPRRYLTA